MGRGPKNVHAHLIGDLLVVRLQGVLTAAEQQLVKTLSSDKARSEEPVQEAVQLPRLAHLAAEMGFFSPI